MGNYREKYFAATPSDHGWYKCRRCGGKFRKKDIDVDHIIPQAHGGSDALYNLQALCKHCNRSKQASLKDTLPDLAGHNAGRVQRKVKTVVESTKKEVRVAIEQKKQAVKEKISNAVGGLLGRK